MRGTYVGRRVAAANRNLLIVNLLVLTAVLVLWRLNWRYVSNCLHGPWALDNAELAQIKDPAYMDHYFVTITGDKAVDTGGTESHQTDFITTSTDHFLLLRVGDRLLLVQASKADTSRVAYSGALTDIPFDVSEDIVAPITKDAPDLAGQILPIMLDATSFHESLYGFLLLSLPLVGLCLWNLKKFMERLGQPLTHPIARKLERYGNPEQIADQIEQERLAGAGKIGKATLTQNWLLYPTWFTLDVAEIPDLVWMYEKVTKTRYAGVVPIGKSSSAEIMDRFGTQISVQGTKKRVEALLAQLHQRAPWAVAGFSAQIEQAVKTDRAQFIAAVQTRRREAVARPAAGASSA